MQNACARKSTRRDFLKVAAAGAAAVPTMGASPPKVGAKPVKIKFFHTEPDPKTIKVINDAAKAFKEKYPHITVEATSYGWAVMEQKILAAHAAGAPPEIANTFGTHIAWAVARGVVRPLDDVYKATGGDKEWHEDMIKLVKWDGKIWSLPWTWGTDCRLVRADLAKEAGLKDPQTWDEFLEWAQALTKPPDRYGFHLAGNAALWFNEDVFEFLGQQGGQMWDDDGLPALVSGEMNDAIEYYKKLAPVMPPGWMADGYVETMSAMALGKSASANLWGRNLGYLEQYAPPDKQNSESYKMLRMPAGKKGRFTQDGFDNICIYSNSRHPEEAAEFLKLFLLPEWGKRVCLSVPLHMFPSQKSVLKDPEYTQNPILKKWKQWTDPVWENRKAGDAWPFFVMKKGDITVPYASEIANAGILGSMIVDVLTKGVKNKEAMETAQARALKIAAETRLIRKPTR